MIQKSAETHSVSIYLSGPLHEIEQACRRECLSRGLCVTVTPTRFVYTGGEETGAVVGLVNYPRFPSTPAEIDARALDLAEKLVEATHQHSVLIVGPSGSTWSTKREGV